MTTDLTQLSVDSIEGQGVEASTGGGNFKVLEPGDYNVMIMSTETKSTKNGDGEGLSVKFSVVDGENAGAEFNSWFNIKNKNEQAAKIGLGEILAMIKVAGVTHAGELEGKTIRVRLSKEPSTWVDRNSGETKHGHNNSIKKIMTLSGKLANGEEVEPFKASTPTTESKPATSQVGGAEEKPLFDSAPDF